MRHHIDDSLVLAIEVPVDDNPRDTCGRFLSRFGQECFRVQDDSTDTDSDMLRRASVADGRKEPV